MSEPELLSCPFCGSRAEIKVGGYSKYVMCLGCEVMGSNLKDEAELVAQWNARQSAPPQTPAPDEQRLCARCSGVVVDRRTMQPIAETPAPQGEPTLINGGAWRINEAAWLRMSASEQTKFLHQISFYEGWKSDTKLPSGFSSGAAPQGEMPPLPKATRSYSVQTCCGQLTPGGDYMGATEMTCCGNPEVEQGDAYTADEMLAYGAQCRAAAIPVSPEQQKILDFLYGIGEIDGKAFGERAQNEGAFWWRKHLKAAFPLIAAAPKGEE